MARDYSEYGLTSKLRSVTSLSESNNFNLKEYIDDRVEDLVRPGGIKYYQTGLGRAYIAVVSSSGAGYQNIQDAINAASNAGGGKILIESGTYNIPSTIKITGDNIQVVGENKINTVIKVPDNTNVGTVISVESNDFNLSSLTIDGNKNNQTDSQVLISGTTSGKLRMIISDVILQNQKGESGKAAIVDKLKQTIIKDCRFENCDGIAISAQSTESLYDNCYAGTVGGGFELGYNSSILSSYVLKGTSADTYGFYTQGNGQIVGCMGSAVNGNTFYLDGFGDVVSSSLSYVGSNAGFYSDEAWQSINSCVSKNDLYGIYLSSSASDSVAVTGNIIDSPKRDAITLGWNVTDSIISSNIIQAYPETDETYSGILVTGTSVRNVITGNNVNCASGTVNYAYGYRESSTGDDYNVVTSNIFNGAGTNIGTQGTNTVVANNVTV